MKTNKLFLSFLTILSLSAAACGGGDGGGSGVEGSKALTELSPAERQDICDYAETLVSEADAKKLGCYFTALFFTETEAECQTAFDGCIAEPDEPTTSDCSIDDAPPACASEVSVSEMEACAREQANAVSSLANSLSCASEDSELSGLEELPPACKAIEAKCPELFDDSEG